MNKYFLWITGIVIVMGGLTVFTMYKPASIGGGIACTMEAKICSDGSAVGRSGPKCEFAACPTASSTPPTKNVEKGYLTGKIILSPTCPVERIPPDPACLPKGYSVLLDVRSAKLSVRVHTDTSGGFYLTLPVGRYTLTPYVEALYPRCNTESAEVNLNSTTTVTISCDTGIR